MYGKSIRLFLIEGESTGRWRCELSNWTGLAFRIPRTMLSKCGDRPELSYTGVYFLIGRTDEGADCVYIGEAEDVLYRINQHVANDKWQDWTECVVFVSKDDGLNKAQIKYLESSLYDLASSAGRCQLVNRNRPPKSSLSEADAAEMEEYLFNLRLLMGTMGYRFLEPPLTKEEARESVVFSMTGPKSGYDAKAIVVTDGIVVLKGSKVSAKVAESMKGNGYHKLRERLCSDGTIVDGAFTRDYHFDSYSASSAVIQGCNSNGWVAWRTEDGRTLSEFMKAETQTDEMA